MNFKTRLKAAFKAFREPGVVQRPVVQKSDPEPGVVMDNRLLTGKNVLITGAGRNIGRSIAIEMAKQGANIFFTDIFEERIANLEQELKAYPVRSQGFLSDISQSTDIDNLYNFFLENQIALDILVNNAGINLGSKSLKNTNSEDWHKTFNTNIFGPIYLTKLIYNMMIDSGICGSILFITSIHQWELGGWASYSSSKAALGMIIQELAIDCARHGIRVNGIAPGWVAEDREGQTFSHQYTPLYQSSINPSYIGRAAVYLASDYFSKFTTGTVIKIDAGLSLRNYLVEMGRPL
jgi:NAD(P)-dependent dehydrogenase (short-subunit alcohol dehydrogenase family)